MTSVGPCSALRDFGVQLFIVIQNGTVMCKTEGTTYLTRLGHRKTQRMMHYAAYSSVGRCLQGLKRPQPQQQFLILQQIVTFKKILQEHEHVNKSILKLSDFVSLILIIYYHTFYLETYKHIAKRDLDELNLLLNYRNLESALSTRSKGSTQQDRAAYFYFLSPDFNLISSGIFLIQ